MLKEGFCWTVSDDLFQQSMLKKSIEYVKKNCGLPTCVITSDKNLTLDVDELIFVPDPPNTAPPPCRRCASGCQEYCPKYDIFTKLKYCPFDLINYATCRCMIIKPLESFLSDKQNQFIIRPNIYSPNRSVHSPVKRNWFVDRTWFRISKSNLESLENWATRPHYTEDITEAEHPLSDWVANLTDKTLHSDLWFPSCYKDMHEVRKLTGINPTDDWLGVPKELFNQRPIFQIGEDEHFEEFLEREF